MEKVKGSKKMKSEKFNSCFTLFLITLMFFCLFFILPKCFLVCWGNVEKTDILRQNCTDENICTTNMTEYDEIVNRNNWWTFGYGIICLGAIGIGYLIWYYLLIVLRFFGENFVKTSEECFNNWINFNFVVIFGIMLICASSIGMYLGKDFGQQILFGSAIFIAQLLIAIITNYLPFFLDEKKKQQNKNTPNNQL